MLVFFDLLFLLGLLAMPVAWLADPLALGEGEGALRVPWWVLGLILVIFSATLRIWWARRAGDAEGNRSVRGPLDREWMKKLVLSLSMTWLFFGAFEGVLRLAGFQFEMAPVVFDLEGTDGNREVSKGYADPELIFRFRKGEYYHGVPINNIGYRDREIRVEKPEGWKRVIAMGDSVTAQGMPGYSQFLHERLNGNPPTNHTWEAFNMAVYGYSSAQGFKVFQLETRQLEPDIVTLFYGWNDHWLELETDRNRMKVRLHPFLGRVHSILGEKRFYQFLTSLLRPEMEAGEKRGTAGFRVPPEEYTGILGEFVAGIREIGAVPILITAPRREVRPTKNSHPEVEIDFNQVHDQYIELTRQVAADLDVPLLDLAERFADPAFDQYFMDDGIHFHQEGLELIAAELDAKIREVVAAGLLKDDS